MLVSLLVALVGCITVPVYEECLGCDSGVEPSALSCGSDGECSSVERCVSGECEYVCYSDEDCDGNYACGRPEETFTDALGCGERCSRDDDCKGGTRCQGDGSCQ